jgi:hypothetical protein
MAQAMIQQQPVDGDFDDAVDPESDISGDDSGMETDEDDNVHVRGNGNGPWVCVPIDEHYEMPYQPGNFFQDPAPMNRPNIIPFPLTCTLSSSSVSIPLSSPLISDSGSTASSKSPSTGCC